MRRGWFRRGLAWLIVAWRGLVWLQNRYQYQNEEKHLSRRKHKKRSAENAVFMRFSALLILIIILRPIINIM